MRKGATLFLAFIYLHSSDFAQQKTNGAYPCLWVNSTQIAQIKKDIKDTTLKMLSWIGLKNDADKYLREPLEIPPKGGNWEQYYISPKTSNVLRLGELVGNYRWKHIDPKTNEFFLGDTSDIEKDYDGVVIGFIHNNWALGLVELGLAYQLSNDSNYFKKAKQILLDYAALYPTLPIRTRASKRFSAQGSGKIHVQDLNEAEWLVNITEGADLIWDKLTEKERTTVATQLLLPAVEVINKRKADISNIQCWRNTATGMVGFLLHNDGLINLSMDDTTGFVAQLKYGFNAEGFTNDLSPNYQFFALHPLCLIAQSAINNNYEINIESMHKMFTTPIQMSNKKLMLPPFNDSRPVDIKEEAFLYDWAYSKFKDTTFSEVIINPKRMYFIVHSGYKFTGWNLLFGYPYLMSQTPHAVQTKNFDSSGVVLLTKGTDTTAISCYLKYTNQTKNLRHFHNAQLDMAIIKGDEYVTVMPGNLNYATPLSDGWFRSSVSHNTLIFNQRQQRRSSGKLLDFGNSNGVDYAIASSANIYVHSAAFVRTVALLNENIVLVVDQFRAAQPEPAIFDICYHQAGVFENRPIGTTWLPPDSVGYKYLINTTQILKQKNFSFSTKLTSKKIIRTNVASSVPTDFITGYGRSFMKENVPLILYRVKTDSIEVITIAYTISTNGKSVKVDVVQNDNVDKKSFTATLQLEFENGKKLKVIINPYKETIVANGISNAERFKIPN